MNSDRPSGARFRPSLGAVLAALLGSCAIALALARVWVADDAYITFRHIVQFLEGNGLTYNTIERVEGFTHPLWAVLLCLFGWLGAPLPGIAVTLDLLCASALLISIALKEREHGPLALALVVSCSGFIDFASSGLETPMTMLFVYIAYQAPTVLGAPVRCGVALSFAYLCHPDAALLAIGPMLLLLAEASRIGWREARGSVVRFVAALAAAPLIWHAFRLFYYRDIWPNTYYAKNGGSYWSQGFSYLVDFATYAPLSAAGVVVVIVLAGADLMQRNDPSRFRRAAGFIAVVVHMAAIARVGGDFMGFRLLLPDLAAVAALCAGSLERLNERTRPFAQAALSAAALWALFIQPVPPHERGLIVNERLNFASAYSRMSDAFWGRPRHLWWNEGRLFRAFQECVGEPSLIVEYPNIGYYGVALGTRASLIDGNGLVDRFVARNWAVRKGLPRGRPGHEGKMTVDYALQRRIHFVRDMFEPYRTAMSTDYGILLSLDPRVLCTLPGKADGLRALKQTLLASSGARSLDTLQFLEDLEKRDGVRIDDVCRAEATPRDCSPAGINRANKAEKQEP
jgi:arabinofuranosyltransferase